MLLEWLKTLKHYICLHGLKQLSMLYHAVLFTLITAYPVYPYHLIHMLNCNEFKSIISDEMTSL